MPLHPQIGIIKFTACVLKKIPRPRNSILPISRMTLSPQRRSVISLNEAMADQERLPIICARKHLDTAEIFTPNDMYGNAGILKDYTGISYDQSLRILIPHGPDITEEFLWNVERDFRLPAIFAHSKNRERVYAERTKKKVFHTAAPYLYVQKMLPPEPPPVRKGTLFFVSHSTEGMKVEADFELQADMLEQLDRRFHPITICIYWLDFLYGHHEPFLQRGFQVVSAGHATEPAFLCRIHHLLSCHEFAMSNTRGGYVEYAIASGCMFLLYGASWKCRYTPRTKIDFDGTPTEFTDERVAKWARMFQWDDPAPREEQVAWADYYLGREWLLTPDQVREQIEHAAWLDKFGVIVRNSGYPTRWVIPPYFTRKLGSMRKLLPGS